MRRRYDAVPPQELLVFEGHRYATESEWSEAFDEFLAARERWLMQHGLPAEALPQWATNGDCPWDPDLI